MSDTPDAFGEPLGAPTHPRGSEGRAWLRVALVYAALLGLAHLPVALFGRSQVPALLYPYGASGRPDPATRRPVSVFDVDLGTPAYYEGPENKLVGDLWRRGEVPLWNAHQAAGMPLLAQYSSRALFPYQILEDVAPTWTWDFFLLGRAWFAGLFAYALLRRVMGGGTSSLLGGALYMLSGSFTWFLSLEQYSNVAMAAPLLLVALDRVAVARRGRDVAGGAVATALVLLAGQPETAFYALAYGGAWTLFRAWTTGGSRVGPALARYFAASALGLLLAAPLLIPFAEYAAAAHHIHPSGGSMGVCSPTPWALVPGIWLPNLFQQPVHAVDLPLNGRWDYLGGYSGTLAWVLVLAALARGRAWRRELVFCAAAAAVVLLKNVDVAPFAWLGRLPVFDQVWTPRWAGPIWTLSLALAAGFAAESLCAPATDAPPPRRWVFPAAALGVLAFAARAAWAFAHDRPSLPRDGLFQAYPDVHFASRASTTALLGAGTIALTLWVALRRSTSTHARVALLALAVGELIPCVPRGYTAAWLNAGAATWAFAALAAAAIVHDRARLAASATALTAVAMAFIDVMSPRGLPPRRDPFAPAPWVTFVRARAGLQRVTSVGGALFPNNAGALGLYDVHYIVALGVRSFHDFSLWLLEPSRPPSHRAWGAGMWVTGVPELAWTPNGLAPGLANLQLAAPLYGLLGVRYVAVPHGARLDVPIMRGQEGRVYPYRKVYSGEVDVWEHTMALPRAWLVHDLRRVASPAELFTQLAGSAVDLRRTALLTEGAPMTPVGDAPADEGVRVVAYRSSEVVLEAHAAEAGLVVLSDVFSEGWRAEVDGRPAPIERVDGCLRGVRVAAGSHRIVQRYQPASVRIGVGLALAAALLCAALARHRGERPGEVGRREP